MRIAYFTDMHITEDGSRLRDIDVRQNFNAVLDDIKSYHPDLIILGGDLAAENGEKGAYVWIQNQVKKIDIPIYPIAGNHDDAGLIKSIFLSQLEIKGSFLDYTLDRNGQSFIFLDSANSYVNPEQIDWLKSTVSKLSGHPILFMHHPPRLCNCQFMDLSYPLKNYVEVWNIIRSLPTIKFIFCGHYHTEKTIQIDHQTIFLTPATFLQISPDHEDYQIDAYPPGWRQIDIDSKVCETCVRYIL